MNRQEFHQENWNYYLMLEKKFRRTMDYVTLSEDNAKTYSLEYAGLIQIVGSELDAFFKVYCGFKPEERKSINDYFPEVQKRFAGINTQKIKVQEENMTITPFDGWNAVQPAQSLKWWLAFDQIKHSRTANYKEANQENVLCILSALYLLEMDFLRQITKSTNEPDIPDIESELFFLQNWNVNYISLGNGLVGEIIK